MLLAIDIGNTNVTCGIFLGRRLVSQWRIATASCLNTSAVARALLKKVGRRRSNALDGVCISNVVPSLEAIFRAACQQEFGLDPLFATRKNVGIPLEVSEPRQVGADRLVNALAAWKMYRRATIVVDFGTATTFDVITKEGAYAGGAIAPGIALASKALSDAAAKLPKVEIKRPKRVIGKRTKECMQSGLFHGYVGLVDHIVRESAKEMGARPLVVATGGMAMLIATDSKTIRDVVPDLTLEGLRLVWEKNREA